MRTTAISASVTVQGANVHYLQWSRPAEAELPHRKPCILLVHGHAANAHWWDGIAPHLTEEYNVAAIDLTGNGDSDHRDVYSSACYAEEMLAVCSELGFEKPLLAGHSFGGTLARLATYLHPAAFTALLLIDSALPVRQRQRRTPPMPKKHIRHYPTLEEAVRRFRLRPPQPAPAPDILHHIAVHAVRQEPQGYRFKLDPTIFAKMTEEPEYPDARTMLAGMTTPCGLIYGAKSRFFDSLIIEEVSHLFRPGCVHAITDAHHHLFLDQPEKALSAIRDVMPRLLA